LLTRKKIDSSFGSDPANELASHVPILLAQGVPLKKLLLSVALALVLTPYSVKAQDCQQSGDNQGDNSGCKAKINATEFAGIGLGGAALICVAGYLMLRRRKAV
jgi:hypothetical protein